MTITDNSNSLFISSQAKSSSRVGSDVLAYCPVCKMNLTHTIITIGIGNTPERAQCNTCKGERKYRAPKSKAELTKMVVHAQEKEKSDEVELDLDAGARILTGEDPPKKKHKAKSKLKKKDDGNTEREPTAREKAKNAALPLSMQEGSAEDIAAYAALISAQKSSVAQAKEYKTTAAFKVNDMLNHKTFGIGFVTTKSSNKIEVLFAKGRKLLVCGG